MANSLPYLVSPGSLKTALERIRAAATPDRVSGDFVSTKLDIKGGTGAALIPFFKKVGFVASDGTPTDLYRKYRNSTSAGAAVAQAIKVGYKALGEVNEYFYDLKDSDLLALIVQVTGVEANNSVAKLTLATLKHLKSLAKFDQVEVALEKTGQAPDLSQAAERLSESDRQRVGLNLSYTINLNLPATSDQSVFNAIFRSLKEHLLSYGKE